MMLKQPILEDDDYHEGYRTNKRALEEMSKQISAVDCKLSLVMAYALGNMLGLFVACLYHFALSPLQGGDLAPA